MCAFVCSAFAAEKTPSDAGPENALQPEVSAKIDKAAREVLAKTGAPSASIAVVENGRLAYVHAYGTANLELRNPATTSMRYSIGSISKQFTATAVLLLAQEHKLSLDDQVARWLPKITRANDVTVRQLLSMTSGYQDYWPQDYVMPNMMQPTTPEEIVTAWGGKPLDFEPGTKWQYSNTNYVIAGLIVEHAAGMPLIDYLRQQVFDRLKMQSVTDTNQAPLPESDPMRYQRFGLAQPRPAPKEGKGWMFAAGELAMTAADLATWDISVIDQTILQPSSYHDMQTEVQLTNGAGTSYGLGVGVSLVDGHRLISHGGEVSGFTALNAIYPDDRKAVVVLTNLDATSAPHDVGSAIAQILFTPSGSTAPLMQASQIFDELQHGKLNRALFSSNANAYFTDQAVKDLAASLAPLGKAVDFSEVSESLRGGMTFHKYRAQFARKNLNITTYVMPDGKLEQYIVAAE
ncbi:MAG: beta-lactamase family protein [Verrucomicrobia bacterium]|nr:beta-lactamase family protein [Verrucomicrobiota bacterium]